MSADKVLLKKELRLRRMQRALTKTFHKAPRGSRLEILAARALKEVQQEIAWLI